MKWCPSQSEVNVGCEKSIKSERAACTEAFNILPLTALTSSSPTRLCLVSKGSLLLYDEASGGGNNGEPDTEKTRPEMGWGSELEAEVYLVS